MLIAVDHEIVKSLVDTLKAVQAELEYARTRVLSTGSDNPINASDAAIYLGLAKSAIYKNLAKIPHRKRHGKLYFFKSELRAYLDAGTD